MVREMDPGFSPEGTVVPDAPIVGGVPHPGPWVSLSEGQMASPSQEVDD